MDLRYLVAKTIYNFIPNKSKRRRIRAQLDAMKVCSVIDNDLERKATYAEVRGITVTNSGKNNKIMIHLPRQKSHINVVFQGDGHTLSIGKNFVCYGTMDVIFSSPKTSPCFVQIGNDFSCVNLTMFLTDGSKIEIGNDCICSRDVQIWGSDGHAILDAQTKQIKNNRRACCVIGNHCWLGARTTIFKKAQIPDNTIVGIGSVVTRKFTQEYTAIAGNPAQIISQNVYWDKRCVVDYLQQTNQDWQE